MLTWSQSTFRIFFQDSIFILKCVVCLFFSFKDRFNVTGESLEQTLSYQTDTLQSSP